VTTPTRKPKTPVRIRKSEIQRAVRGVQDIGLTVQRVDVYPDSGKFSLVTGKDSAAAVNPWDEVLSRAPRSKRSV
jgi:hypothetical protein